MAIANAFLLLLLLLAAPAVYAVDYTVGDSAGWTSTGDYNTWVSGKTFKVGDVLVFNYGVTHQVYVVDKSDYDNCVSSNAVQTYNDGNTRVNLTTPGSMYFICPTPGHCANGMKLAVTVEASSTTPSSGTPPTSSGSTPPSTSSSNTSPPPPPHSGAATTLCNMMLVIVSLVVGKAFMC